MRRLVFNADIVGDGLGWILVDGPFISDMGFGPGRPASVPAAPDLDEYDAAGLLLMPGAVDCHVHFREPGLTHKATISSESQAALLGGVTSFFDMPNTVPQTVTISDWQRKMDIAAASSAANYAFFIGATASNLSELLRADFSRIPGVKLFLGSSTGNMLVDDPRALDSLFSSVPAVIVVHAEDEAVIARSREAAILKYGPNPPVAAHSEIRPPEACVAATRRAVDLALRHGARLHIAHLSTAAEIDLVRQAGPLVSCEVSPHHLTFSTLDYPALGARIKMNPAVKGPSDRQALRQALGRDIRIVATDHAPHLLSEKQGDALSAVSGAPMVQFSLPLMLSMFPPRLVADVMAAGPADRFRIDRRGRLRPGCYADIVLLRRDPWTVSDQSVHPACPARWTPLVSRTLSHRVHRVYLNGQVAVDTLPGQSFASLVPDASSAAMPLAFIP